MKVRFFTASFLFVALSAFGAGDEPVQKFELDVKDFSQLVVDDGLNVEYHSNDEMAGKAVNPVMEPLGFSWRGTVAALAGVPAKEIVVSTLGVLYTGDEAENAAKLGERLESVNPATGRPDFTAAEALSFMVFILLYCPCLATVTAIARETGSWKWAAFSVVYNTLVAWLVAFAVYRAALLAL